MVINWNLIGYLRHTIARTFVNSVNIFCESNCLLKCCDESKTEHVADHVIKWRTTFMEHQDNICAGNSIVPTRKMIFQKEIRSSRTSSMFSHTVHSIMVSGFDVQ